MARSPLLVVAALLAGCLSGPQPAALERETDDRLVRQIADQLRWAKDAVASRAEKDELDAARAADADAVTDLRKRLRKLTAAVERTTWVREAAALSLQEGGGDEPALAADFERAAQLRSESLEEADEIAQALAVSKVPRALTLSELRNALLGVRRAQEAEQRLAKIIGKAAESAPQPHGSDAHASDAHASDGGTPAAQVSTLGRLSTTPMPVPRPFISAAAKLLDEHPDEGKGLASFGPQLSEEATQIRAQLADLEASRPPEPAESTAAAAARSTEPKLGAQEGANAAPASAAPPTAADAKPPATANVDNSFTVAGDVKKLLQKRGPPRAIATRPDGLLALRYQEPRPCGVESCPALVDYLFDAQGKLVRDQVVDKKQ